jgi:hypothetical protein
MTYGEFSAVVNTQDNASVRDLLDHNVVLEMDGLSSSSDRTMFSEALTLYLYRFRLAQGSQSRLTNLIVLEEAHNLLLQKAADSRESMLENSIRMIRQYGMGYVFVDQSASLLSKVAFANSYATLALSQKLRSDVQTISGAMNLSDEQKESLSTLPIGTAIVRLADEHPEPFLVKVPRCQIQEGSVGDTQVQARMAAYYADSRLSDPARARGPAIPPLPVADRIIQEPEIAYPHPPTHQGSPVSDDTDSSVEDSDDPSPTHAQELSREEIRFLADLAARPLSTTVSRYERLKLSRRKGNAIRQHLDMADIVRPVVIATRSGQVVLCELTENGRSLCMEIGIDPRPKPRESLEHRYWIKKAHEYFQGQGYDITREHVISGNGAIDLLAERPGERVAIEVETGKSDIAANLEKLKKAGFGRVVMIATSPEAITACRRTVEQFRNDGTLHVEQLTWLDL